ncbi:MAG: DivIVA domain-containing protein [Acetanaerobacterium sp.]
MLSPGDINTKKFEKSAFGYRIDDVNQYLTTVAEEYATILHENDELEKKIVVLADRLEEYREQEGSLSAALLGAQKMSDKLIGEAKEQVAKVIGEANTRAQKIVNDAQREVSRERNELVRVQREIATFKNNLLAMYTSQIDMIRTLPDADRKRRETPAAKTEDKPAKFVYNDVQDVEEVKPVSSPDKGQGTFGDTSRQPVAHEGKSASEPQKTVSSPKGFMPNLADDDIADSAYQTPAAPPLPKGKAPAFGIDIPFEEDATDDVPLAADPSGSKFGELKFGAGYDLDHDGSFGMGKRKKR